MGNLHIKSEGEDGSEILQPHSFAQDQGRHRHLPQAQLSPLSSLAQGSLQAWSLFQGFPTPPVRIWHLHLARSNHSWFGAREKRHPRPPFVCCYAQNCRDGIQWSKLHFHQDHPGQEVCVALSSG